VTTTSNILIIVVVAFALPSLPNQKYPETEAVDNYL
jgi:hypothetical protein